MFSVSDKVVYIGGPKRKNCIPITSFGLPRLEVGRVYVVRDIWESYRATEGVLIQLVGYPDVMHPRLQTRMGFTPSRFRKLTDIQAENSLRNSEVHS